MTDPTASSFDAFYRDRWPAAVRLGRLLVGDDAIAEQLAQDVFIGMRARWASIASPDAYLRRSLVNRAQNHGRRARREVVTDDIGVHERPTTAAPDVDELWPLVQALPHRYRAALVLRFYEDLPERAIADILGCRPGTVKSLISRGLDRLRAQL